MSTPAPETTIDAGTLREWLEQGRPVTVLDVRPTAERAEWAIPGSLHVDAYDALWAGDPQALSGVDLPGDRPVVTVCAMGRTSLLAARRLRQRGLNALSLAGGMRAWSLAWNTAEVPLPGRATRVIQVRRTGKGCLSYLIASAGQAAVIDAALDPQVYWHLAQQQGWQIVAVLDTHIHADHLSRSRSLAAQTGATLYLPNQARVAYPFAPLRDGDRVRIGAAQLSAWHTPGHTPESVCYQLDGAALFTGDTLFTQAVGRPDLHAHGVEARVRAHALYASLRRLQALPPETLILPGHASAPASFDGQPLVATLAEVRAQCEWFHLPEAAFVESLLARLPRAPPNHARIVELNRAGVLVDDPTELEAGANRCAVV